MGSPQFYVATALGERTAGPEALTQLVDAIRRRGIEAYLVPMRNYRGRTNDPEYDIYDFEVRDTVPRTGDVHLVIPEVSPIESRRELSRVPRARTWMGWFSVNNSPDPRARYYRPSERCCPTYPPGYQPAEPPVQADHQLGAAVAGSFATWREASRRVGGASPARLPAAVVEDLSMRFARRLIDSDIRFFAQAHYSAGFVRQVLNRSAPIITDPIRVVEVPDRPRQRAVVLYNKAKSWSLVPEVMRLMPDVEFRAVEGMSFQQVAEALSTATVYLELGHLPGRDRMPREAAHFGTPVVCLARGAGYCYQDVPLPVQYRVAYREGWAQRAAEALSRVLDDPRRAAEEQEGYRQWVAGERERYESAVDSWLAMALA